MVQIDIGWVLAAIGGLASTVAAMAGIMWSFMQSRLRSQDMIIAAQAVTIGKLQEDVDRMAKGCGHPDCHWTQRIFTQPKMPS